MNQQPTSSDPQVQTSADGEPETYRLQKPDPRPKFSSSKKRANTPLPSFFFGQLPMEHETSLFILVSVLDIIMTWYLLTHSGNRIVEANPVAAFFLYRWGGNGLVGFKMFMVAVVCIITQLIARKKPTLGLRVLNLGTLIVAMVVVYSFILASRLVHAE